ncbi:ArnT family glycosyltransferase [Haloarchaeobius sp. DFWS5]|uniref:ArnT family glycosyltransferase n=1 Tax=Haloarchaeobius sp. DFWS5 TaxID=3446114 RepID=UPI003EB750A5
MAHRSHESRTNRIGTRLATVSLSQRTWLAIPLLAAIVVYVSYLATHPYPAFGAGLYVEIADTISANGYALPATVPGYTEGGVPAAYPPLMFYLTAVVRDLTGVDAMLFATIFPGLVVIATVVPYFYVAREFLATDRRAAFATLIFAVAPPVLQWHLSAGGLNRAPAFFLVVTGVYAGIQLFRHDDLRWLGPALGLFSLTILTHPTYAVCFGLNYLLLYAAFDRTSRGLVHGAVVALGGVLVTAPWWLTVAGTHGFDVFTGAAGTHSGLGGGTGRLYDEFVQPITDKNVETPFFLAAYAGSLYALVKRRFFLPVWLFVSAYVLGKLRFQFLAASLLIAILVFELAPRLADRVDDYAMPDWRATLSFVIVGLVALSALVAGSAYAAGAVDAHAGSPSQPAFVDEHDVDAMEWAAANTVEGEDFVVLGDAAEWFPLYTDRTILVGPWGVEWTTPAQYEHHLNMFRDTSTCNRAACITSQLEDSGHNPEYIYVPKGHYTVRGMSHQQSSGMVHSLEQSDRYQKVYENDGVLIVKVTVSDDAAAGTDRVEQSAALAIENLRAPADDSPTRPTADRPRRSRTSLHDSSLPVVSTPQ